LNELLPDELKLSRPTAHSAVILRHLLQFMQVLILLLRQKLQKKHKEVLRVLSKYIHEDDMLLERESQRTIDVDEDDIDDDVVAAAVKKGSCF
jgi:hypothetical protein